MRGLGRNFAVEFGREFGEFFCKNSRFKKWGKFWAKFREF